VAKVCC